MLNGQHQCIILASGDDIVNWHARETMEVRWARVVLSLLLAERLSVRAQGPGNGISKATYATNDPTAGHAFLLEYFPVSTATDECTNDVCKCVWAGDSFDVQQGRVYLDVPLEEQVRAGAVGCDPSEAEDPERGML